MANFFKTIGIGDVFWKKTEKETRKYEVLQLRGSRVLLRRVGQSYGEFETKIQKLGDENYNQIVAGAIVA